jgi:hypothetical protein
MKRKYRIGEPIPATNQHGSLFELQPADYFADTDTDEDWVTVHIDLRPVFVSRADFDRVSKLVNP